MLNLELVLFFFLYLYCNQKAHYMRRYFYSFYLDEGSLSGKFITTTSFFASSLREADFMASCYCSDLSSDLVPHYSVCYKFITFEVYGK